MFEKILVPVDGSKDSRRAAQQAVDIADKYNSSITLLHVINPVQLTGLGGLQEPPMIVGGMVESLTEAGEAILQNAREELGTGAKIVSTQLLWGVPDRVIIDLAKEQGFGLIVMGSRGLGAITGLLLGSVSDRVVNHSPCPVLIIK